VERPWAAEAEVVPELARRLIESQFPALAPARAEPFGVGWDNTAWLVNGSAVFRFPRRQMAVPLLVNECRVLPLIADRVELPVPRPAWIGRATDEYRWPFAGYPMLPGRTADRANLDDGARAAAAGPLARFLRSLHALEVDAGPDTIDRLNLATRGPRIRTKLAELMQLGLIADAAPFEHVIAEAVPAAGTRRLVHGDLYSRHLLVDEGGRVTGVIDWGDVHTGHPAIDLSLAHAFLPRSAHDEFRRVYGPIDEGSWRLARFKALLTAVMIVAYGHDTKDADMRREGLWTLAQLVK
jgi:aminoglycoside phosphotransferase (APT) family kinase protein